MGLSSEQQRIVDAPCGNILVSAAAGSGKTTVMTERIVKRILDRELSVENVLVMTFTNAAAANMSAKLEKRLREKLSETADKETRKYLSEQIAALPSAYISTIDSFCSRVISNFSAQGRDESGKLLLEPKSMILDEVHAKKLLTEAFNEVFSEAYSLAQKIEDDPELGKKIIPLSDEDHLLGGLISEDLTYSEWARSFLAMVSTFGSGRDDTNLKEDMAGKLGYLRSLPDYVNWVKNALQKKKNDSTDFLSSDTYEKIMKITRKAIEKRISVLPAIRDLIPRVAFLKKEKDNLVRQQDFLEWCTFLEENGRRVLTDPEMTWDDICEIRKKRPSDKPPTYSMRSPEPELVEFDDISGAFYELAYILAFAKKTETLAASMKDETRYFFGKTLSEITEELTDMYPIYERYFEFVFAAERIYQQKKRLEHGMDFPDQEQVALSLLANPEVSGYFRDLFSEIYIDEYQDNSGVQDAIVQCFAKDNVFFVGDVKQSIYRFRHAKPQMFLDRCELYRDGQEGTLFTLNNNFRSVPGILSSVNRIFSGIMSEEYADIEYDSTHALNPGLPEDAYTQTSGADITLILAEDSEENADAEENDMDQILDMKDAEKVQKETLIIAQKIFELQKLEGFSYDQCVVLTTSNRGAMAASDILMKYGIPAQGPSLGNILNQPDLRIMLDLARLTDNILQDIPLAGIMKSKIRQAGFTDEDLMKIYLFSDTGEYRDLLFCEKVLRFAREDDSELALRVSDLLSFINDLRTLSMQMTVTKWLEHVYAQTGYPSFVRSQENGDARYYALMALVTWATRFDMGRRAGLRAFVGYIDELDQGKDKSTEIDLSEPLENVVRCMTIHKSKGLEFPYVFLCGIQSAQQSTDTSLILSEKGDLAARRFAEKEGVVYEPHDYYILSQEEKRESEAEKIRLLYVALTRAEKKVFVISLISRTMDDVIKSCDSVLASAAVNEEKFPPSVMCRLKTHLTRFMAGQIRIPGYPLMKAVQSSEPVYAGDLDFTKNEREAGSPEVALISDSIDKISNRFITNPRPVVETYSEARAKEVDVDLTEDQKKHLELLEKDIHDWAKPDLLPSKTTVSEMKRLLSEEAEPDEDEKIDFHAVNMRVKESDQKWKDKGYTASQLGTLLHSAWQYIDFTGLLAKGEITDWDQVIRTLSDHGMITKDQEEILAPFKENMQMFLQSELAERMCGAESRQENGPFREIPFALAWPNENDDFSLVQGMIDCWFIDTDGDAVLIDYKSDRIPGTEEEKRVELKKRYQVQLDMYAQAITAATGRKVKEKIIWLIRDGLSFEF